MAQLSTVEGIGDTYAAKLEEAGITTTDELLEKGSTPSGRKDLASMTEISSKRILEWVNHVDLFRVNGVGQEFADLLEAAGVDTVPELARRSPLNLYERMIDINKEKKLIRRLPSPKQVEDWIKEAKKLPRVITY
jgi:predicted flap endonuclease-1-like 5' DNA nuclease